MAKAASDLLHGALMGASPALRDDLAGADRTTLEHLLRKGLGKNSVRAIRSDLAYLEAWCTAATGAPLPWPPTRALVLRFIAHHLWDPAQREIDGNHGMPIDVETTLRAAGRLRKTGPHAPSTVRRRLATWRAMCAWQNLTHPFADIELRKTLGAAIRATDRPTRRKSRTSVDRALIERLLEHLTTISKTAETTRADQVRAVRDRALLALMFGAGGRRRTEVAELVCSQIAAMPAIPVEDDTWPAGLPSIAIKIGRTKTTNAATDTHVYASGAVVLALNAWLSLAKITKGPVFRRIDRWGNVYETPISGHSVNAILKKRLAEIGQNPADFSAHGIRSGYISAALKSGIPAPEIMEQTLHRSVPMLMRYFKDEEQRTGRAARLL